MLEITIFNDANQAMGIDKFGWIYSRGMLNRPLLF